MPFFARQAVPPVPFVELGHYEDIVDEKGFVSRKFVRDSAPLPEPELFSLGAMQRAGVNIREVSTRILGGSLAVAEAIEHFSQDNKE